MIEFAKMNPLLRINKTADIPEFCHLIPSRWLVEGLVVSSVRHNLISRKQKAYSKSRKELISTGRMTADLSLSMARDYQRFLDSHPESRYQKSNEQHLGE
ncbi:MAG: hypothetical protein LRZ88_03240 [Candidatus Cloacimonetes bacterium]|nr:hypothetical protein [Candidatus Cloacimonadota bacterium]